MTKLRRSKHAGEITLLKRIDEVARAPLLLVASDFDGSIAPLVPHPAYAEADRASVVALNALSAMPQTHVAIISGRSLGDLAGRTRELDDAYLVGSHGSEFEPGFVTSLSSEAATLYQRLAVRMRELTNSKAGLLLEEKPTSLAFHYRNAEECVAQGAIEEVMDDPATWPGLYVRQGKKVIEFSVVETSKGIALRRIRQQFSAKAVVFIGDDLTDEDAFETLGDYDVGIKVGPGDSVARFRAADTLEVAQTLARLAESRSEWIAGSKSIPAS